VCGLWSRSGKRCPRTRPKAFSSRWQPVRRKSQPHQATTPHSPSRIPPRGWQTRCWSGARTLHFIGAASCRC
jgi:hypothetical protein